MGQLNNDQIVGIVLIVLGVLLLFGGLSWILVTILGVALIVVGILLLMGNLKGPTWLAITCLVIGILIVLPAWKPVKDVVESFIGIVIVVVAVLLIVLGIMKLIQKP